jgi:hypothetical protein
VEIKEFPVHVISKEEIVDTTGAGDAFAGGFLAGLVEGKELKTCVDMGMWLAAKSLKELGPSYVDFLFPFCADVFRGSGDGVEHGLLESRHHVPAQHDAEETRSRRTQFCHFLLTSCATTIARADSYQK